MNSELGLFHQQVEPHLLVVIHKMESGLIPLALVDMYAYSITDETQEVLT